MSTIKTFKIDSKGRRINRNIEKVAEIASKLNIEFDSDDMDDMMELIEDAKRLLAEIEREASKAYAV